MNWMDDEDKHVIVCIPACRAKVISETAQLTNCELCNQEVYASATAMQKVKIKEEKWHIVCHDCTQEMVNSEEEVKIRGFIGKSEVIEFPEDVKIPNYSSIRNVLQIVPGKHLKEMLEEVKDIPIKDVNKEFE